MEGVPKMARVDTRHWLLSIFLNFFSRPASLYCEEYVCECVQNVNEFALLPNYTASEAFPRKLGAVRIVDWIFITGVPALRWLGEYVTLDKTFYSLRNLPLTKMSKREPD